jgi:hypothetical protein
MAALAKAFDIAMLSIYERALTEARYPAVRFCRWCPSSTAAVQACP